MSDWPFHPLERRGYRAILADPPWRYNAWSDLGLGRSPERHYATQALDWICSLPVGDLAEKDCHLFLWITGPTLAAGWHTAVLDAWGFKASSIHTIWIKPKKSLINQHSIFPLVEADSFVKGQGKTSRQNGEFVVLGRRGNPTRHTKAMHQLIVEPRREHSRKPDVMRARVEEYIGPEGRIVELFARSSPPSERWDYWGNEVKKFPAATAA